MKKKRKPKKFKPGYIFHLKDDMSNGHEYWFKGVIIKVDGDKFYFKPLAKGGLLGSEFFDYFEYVVNDVYYIQANTKQYKRSNVIGKADLENIELLYTNKEVKHNEPLF